MHINENGWLLLGLRIEATPYLIYLLILIHSLLPSISIILNNHTYMIQLFMSNLFLKNLWDKKEWFFYLFNFFYALSCHLFISLFFYFMKYLKIFILIILDLVFVNNLIYYNYEFICLLFRILNCSFLYTLIYD